jgi:hypothetical protein
MNLMSVVDRFGLCTHCKSGQIKKVVDKKGKSYWTKASGQVSGCAWFPSRHVRPSLCERCYAQWEKGEI